MGVRKYSDALLIEALPRVRNMRELLIELGLVPRGGNYESLWSRIELLGLDTTHLRRVQGGRSIHSCGKEEIARAVKASRSYAQVLALLGVRPGRNQAVLKERIAEFEIDMSHFKGMGWSRGETLPGRRRPVASFLVVGRRTGSNQLKRRLIEEGLKEARCEVCGLDRWNGRPIPLELDHVNGRRDDNRLENLRILCPNCHAQTPTYRGRNIGRPEFVS